jgi:hypothetical protein
MRLVFAFIVAATGFFACVPAHAWKQETHRRIVLDAVAYMKNNPDHTNHRKLLAGVTRAGYTMDQFARALAQGAYDVDDFADTYQCGAISGNCVYAPVWNLGASVTNYTSFWHFQNHTAGRDVHGNPFGGYNYAKLAVPGDIDKLAATWLYGDYLDDGSGGMRGWFGDSSKYNSYGITEARYRLGGYSTPRQYADFEKMPFQPVDNLGQYWWQQFLARPTAQSLGFVLHTTDIVQPHHTWSTIGNHHSGWEAWVAHYYHAERLNDPALVRAAVAYYTPLAANAVDIRPLLTQAGTYSYRNGGIVLSSTDHRDRRRVGRQMIPHAIALVVHILNRAAERLSQ